MVRSIAYDKESVGEEEPSSALSMPLSSEENDPLRPRVLDLKMLLAFLDWEELESLKTPPTQDLNLLVRWSLRLAKDMAAQ